MTRRFAPPGNEQGVPEPFASLRRLDPPVDVLDAVMSEVAMTPQRASLGRLHAWPKVVLGFAAVIVALVVVANAVVWLGGELRVGPPPPDNPQPTPSPVGSAEATARLAIPRAEPVAVAAEIGVPNVHAIQVMVGEARVWMVGDDSTLYEIEPATNQVVGQVPLPPHVPAGAVGFGSAWFADTGADVLRRIDLDSGDIAAEIPVGDRPETVSIGPDAVWVSNLHSGTVSRIDPRTNEVVADVEIGNPGASGPKWIGIGEGDVWVSVPNRNAVVRIDTSTNEVMASVPVDSSALACGDVLVQPTLVWVSSCDEREAVIRVDRSSEVAESWLVPGNLGMVEEVRDLVAFTLTERGNPSSIVLLDPATGEAVRNLSLGEYGFFSIAAGFDSLWIANESGGPVMRVDLDDLLP